MKTFFYTSLIFLFFYGCQKEDKLSFEIQIIENENCEDCPKVFIEMPKALEQNQLSTAINTALKEEVISLLSFDSDEDINSVQKAIKSFNQEYTELQKLYTDETADWEADIKGVISFEDEQYITIVINSHLFTGGAHGYTSTRFLNFDKLGGTEMDNNELFESPSAFSKYAENLFRKAEKIPEDKPINHTGFMFERDSFHLPENIGFTEKGLKLLYNPYEVASFSDGIIEIDIPHSEIKKYLVQKP